MPPHRGILLYGPPGTGKSTLARAAACEAGVPLFAINGPDVVSQFYGESEEALRAVFTAAEEAAPSVVLSNSLIHNYLFSAMFLKTLRVLAF